MKKKYVAVMLGLVLSMSTVSVYAAGSTAVTVAADSSSDSSTDDSSGDDKNAPQGEKPDGEPPAKPDGDNSEPPSGEKPDGEPPQGDVQGGPGGQSQGVESYDAANDYTEDATVDGETLSSTGTDENVAHISDGARYQSRIQRSQENLLTVREAITPVFMVLEQQSLQQTERLM